MLLTGDPGSLAFYPIQLIQLTTVGDVHNLAPSAIIKIIPLEDKEWRIPIFRFYFDGLIAHIHRQASDDEYRLGLSGPLMVGGSDKLAVITVTYDMSFQQKALHFSVTAEAGKILPKLGLPELGKP